MLLKFSRFKNISIKEAVINIKILAADNKMYLVKKDWQMDKIGLEYF